MKMKFYWKLEARGESKLRNKKLLDFVKNYLIKFKG